MLSTVDGIEKLTVTYLTGGRAPNVTNKGL